MSTESAIVQSSSTASAITSIPMIRATSAVLSTFPWATDFLMEDLSSIGEAPAYQGFVASIEKLENELNNSTKGSSTAGSVARSDFYQFLAKVSPEDDKLPHPPKLHRVISTKLCALLCSYRLCDVLYSLNNPRTSYRNPRYPRLNQSGLRPVSVQWPLHDWASTLRQARVSLDSLISLRTPSPGGGDASAGGPGPSTALSDPEPHLQVKLFKELYSYWNQSSGVKILLNIQVAAIHLSFMLQSSNPNETLAIPNLPDNSSEVRFRTQLSTQEHTFLESILGSNDHHKLRHPLQSALLFSPIYLLSNKKMTNNSFDQEKMMLLSKTLGNNKPAILTGIENQLWRSLLDVATGKASALTALQTFVGNVPWNELDMLDDCAAEFFSNFEGEKVTHILSVQGESSLDAMWPLAQLRRPAQILDIPSQSIHSSPAPAPAPDLHSDHEIAAILTDANQAPPSSPPSSASASATDNRGTASSSAVRRSATSQPRSTVPRWRKSRRPHGQPRTAAAPDHRVLAQPEIFVTYQEAGEGVFLQEVEFEPIGAQQEQAQLKVGHRNRVFGPEVRYANLAGEWLSYLPSFHFEEDIEDFASFHQHVQHCYFEDRPSYLSNPESSSVKVLSHEEYSKMSVKDVQTLLGRKHIAITDIPIHTVGFDEDGLQILTNLDARIDIRDHSIPGVDLLDIDHNRDAQLCTATLEHVLACSRDSDGPIVNTLSLPMPLDAIQKSPFSSDVEAWRLTEGMELCDSKRSLYPTADMRWGYASTAGARRLISIAPNGLGAYVEIRCGGEWWLIFSDDNDDCLEFSRLDTFTKDFKVSQAPSKFTVEAVFLTPGTRLIMKPNTPHAVFTFSDTVALGGYFYSFSTMQRTLVGIYHSVGMDSVISRTGTSLVRILLFRMLQYLYKFFVRGADPKKHHAEHLPDLRDSNGFFNAVALCSYCILSNAVDFRTYRFPSQTARSMAAGQQLEQRIQHDYNALSPADRQHFSYIRGLALNFVDWMQCNLIVFDCEEQEEGVMVETLVGDLILTDSQALLRYRDLTGGIFVSANDFTSLDIKRQIELLFYDKLLGWGPDNFEVEDGAERDVFFAALPSSYVIGVHRDPNEFTETDPLQLGTVEGDAMFQQGYKCRFSISENRVGKTSVDTGMRY